MRVLLLLVCVVVVLPTFDTPSRAEENLWYYCSATHQFYPHVQNCSVPWKPVYPYKAVPLGEPTNIVPQPETSQSAQPEDAQNQQSSPEPAPEKTQAQDDPRTAQQDAQYRHDRAIEKAKEKGYELIPTVKDLILDGKELAVRSAKIQITGYYKKMGQTGVLYASPMDAYSNDDNYFPVLTGDAQRALRSALMDYPCQTEMGCQLEVGGHVTMCDYTDALHAGDSVSPSFRSDALVRISWRAAATDAATTA